MARMVEAVDRRERVFWNQDVQPVMEGPTREAEAFHRRLPGYAPSPLRETEGIARELGLARLWVKDESERLGLPAFKIIGASWAAHRAVDRALVEATGRGIGEWVTPDELSGRLGPLRPLTLACATDGNHGRAVARMAKLFGLGARIFVPIDMAAARQAAIASEGARVIVVDGTYDDAVARAAAEADARTLVISDTSWPGYEDVPRWVIEGYSTILWEVEDELARRGEAGPEVVAVQIGVGALAAAVVRHYRRPEARRSLILGVEPTAAACLLASMEAGEIVQIPGPHDSIMSGLNAGLPSEVAWPTVSRGIDAFIAVDDERARTAVRALAREGIVAGECGAAGLAGLMTWGAAFGGDLAGKRALVITTEGATDPEAWRAIVGPVAGSSPHPNPSPAVGRGALHLPNRGWRASGRQINVSAPGAAEPTFATAAARTPAFSAAGR